MYTLKPIDGKFYCKNGHEYIEENTIFVINKKGATFKQCKICKAAAKKKYYEKLVGHSTNGNPRKELTHCKNGHEFTEENTCLTKDGYRHCRQCARDSANEFRKDHPEIVKEKKLEWHLKSRYNLTIEERDAMLASQDGKCKICGRDDCHWGKGFNDTWHIDHDHITNKVRGILCAKCNTALGRLEEIGLQKFTDYLCGLKTAPVVKEDYLNTI